VNVRLPEVPPPGPLLVTEKLRSPETALPAIVMTAFKVLELSTVVEFTVIPSPTSTELASLRNFVPVKTTSSLCDLPPLFGSMLAKVGVGLLTVKATLSDVPLLGPLLVTEKLRLPVAARTVIVRLAFRLVELVTVVEFTVIPDPTFTELTILLKFLPVKTTSKVSNLLPLAGEMVVKATDCGFTANI
jgi:hypothetical protein